MVEKKMILFEAVGEKTLHHTFYGLVSKQPTFSSKTAQYIINTPEKAAILGDQP